MAATILIRRFTGAGAGSPTDITGANTRLSTSDQASPGTTDPIPIPGSGSNYCYWVSTRLDASTSPAGTINNLRWFSDGSSFGTGLVCSGQAANVGANGGYVPATGTIGVTGLQLTAGNHSGLTGAPVDVTTLTASSPKSLAGSVSNPTTGDFGDFFVFQLAVGSSASAGTIAQRTFSWRYDET